MKPFDVCLGYAAMMMTYKGMSIEDIDNMSISRFLMFMPDLEALGMSMGSEMTQEEIRRRRTKKD